MDFAHLHCHTDYSLYDGFQTTQQMVLRAKQLDMPAIAMTDHGKIGGFLKLRECCLNVDDENDVKKGEIYYGDKKIKPIYGVEAYVVENLDNKKGKRYHLTILAKNIEGYHNLLQLVTESHEHSYRGFPRIDFGMLKKYSEGLIVLSGCAVSQFSSYVISENFEGAEKTIRKYKELFGEDYYLEVMWTKFEPQLKVIDFAKKMADKYDIKIVATNDAHYTYRKQAEFQKLKISISRNAPYFDKDFQSEYYVKTASEMKKMLGSVFDRCEESMENTLEIVDKCNVDLQLGYIDLPQFEIPKDDKDFEEFKKDKWGKNDEENYLLYLAMKGLEWRGLSDKLNYRERLINEFETIRFTTFQRYFLIVHEYCEWARKNKIKIGAGRGSGAGSLILYCLGVTNIDPIKYDLSMDRFLYVEGKYRAKVDDFFDVIEKEEEIECIDNTCMGGGIIEREKDTIDPTRGAVGAARRF